MKTALGTDSSTALADAFLDGRPRGTSQQTIAFYRGYLSRAGSVISTDTKATDIVRFMSSLQCSPGGAHAYFRTLRAFHRWLYSPRSGLGLNPQNNPMIGIDPPRVGKRLLPSITEPQVGILIQAADSLRDKCIISLLADSGLRLRELAGIRASDIDWTTRTVVVIGKGNKERRAPFTSRTEALLKAYLATKPPTKGSIWGIPRWGIAVMLDRLGKETGIKANAHSFRRGFACALHRKGLSTLSIMHLGGWSNLAMVERYTRAISFDDCLVQYQGVFN